MPSVQRGNNDRSEPGCGTFPAPGELFVLWDGAGLMVKRVEALTAKGTLRLVSAHPDYPPYERRADEIHIVGKVLWKVTRA